MEPTLHTTNDTNDRRRHERRWTVRGCRIRALNRLRADPGETANISECGALIRVGSGWTFAIGEEVEVVIAWEGEGLVRSDRAIRGVVRRVVPMDFHHQALGLEFEVGALGAFGLSDRPARAAA